MKVGVRKAIEVFGGENIEIHKGYHDQYGFFEKDNQLYYFSTGDDRMMKRGQLDFYYRKAENRKDYTGGINTFDFIEKINAKGYFLTKFPKSKEYC